jgi:hypothetical protein
MHRTPFVICASYIASQIFTRYFSWTKIAPKGEDIPPSITFEYGLAPQREHLGPDMWRKAQGNNERVPDRMKLCSVSPSFVAVSQLRRPKDQLSRKS